METLHIYLTYLKELKKDTPHVWGKMTAQHMVEHLIMTMQLSNGKLKVKCFNPPEKIPVLKRILLSDRPLPRNYINPVIGEDLLPLTYPDIEEAKRILDNEINNYYKYFEINSDAKLTNPTFGDLNKDEWLIFHHKHFTHHLKQFGFDL